MEIKCIDWEISNRVKVKDIMTKEVVFVDPETSMLKVAEILIENRFHSVPVVSEGRVVGIVTETDFFDKKSGHLYLPTYINVLEETGVRDNLPADKKRELSALKEMKVRDIMTTGCLTVNPEMQLSQLVDMFKKTAFHSFAVTDKKSSLQGIVTLYDIVSLIKI